jgi:hypothetical protein
MVKNSKQPWQQASHKQKTSVVLAAYVQYALTFFSCALLFLFSSISSHRSFNSASSLHLTVA